jgi:hypothetical protein
VKRKSNLVYPAVRTAPDPRIDVVLAYAPAPPPSECAGHPGIATVWEMNQGGPGWHCRICHALPEAEAKGETK